MFSILNILPFILPFLKPFFLFSSFHLWFIKPKDNDTTASIVGAAMGALYGKEAFKEAWITDLSGRIREGDDGKIFEMITRTKEFLSSKSQ